MQSHLKVFIKKAVVLTLLAVASLDAKGSAKSIIAIEYGSGQISQTYGSASTGDNRDVTMAGVRIGARESIKRLYLSYRKHTIENELKETTGNSFSIEYDALGAENGAAIFAGLILGYSNYEFLGADGNARSEGTVIYGLNIGLAFEMDFIGFDIGYRYTMPMDTENDDIAAQHYKISDTATTYFSLSYLY